MDESSKKQEFFFELACVARVWKKVFSKYLDEVGVGPGKASVLLHLSYVGQPIVQKELVELLGVSSPTLVVILKGLVAEGWVSKTTNGKNRRQQVVSLTESGYRKADEVSHCIEEVNRRLLKGVDRIELAKMLDWIGNIP